MGAGWKQMGTPSRSASAQSGSIRGSCRFTPLTGFGIICAATNPSSVTARRSSAAASRASCSVSSAAAFMRSGAGRTKSAAQSFQARQSAWANSGSNASTHTTGSVRKRTATSMPSTSIALTCEAESKPAAADSLRTALARVSASGRPRPIGRGKTQPSTTQWLTYACRVSSGRGARDAHRASR